MSFFLFFLPSFPRFLSLFHFLVQRSKHMTIWEIQHSLEILLFKVSEIEQLLISNVYLFNSFLPQFKAIKFWLQKIFIYLLKSQVVWQTVEHCQLFVTKWNWVNFIDLIAISKLMYSNSKTCVSKTANIINLYSVASRHSISNTFPLDFEDSPCSRISRSTSSCNFLFSLSLWVWGKK